MIEVHLSKIEMSLAQAVGRARHNQATKDGCQNAHGCPEEGGKNKNIIGALGEMAACKAANIYWEPRMRQYSTNQPDIGQRTEVRTRTRHHYDLLVRKSDREDRLYLLVTNDPDTRENLFLVQGIADGRACRQEKWLKEYGGREEAYFIPKRNLVCLDKWPGLRL